MNFNPNLIQKNNSEYYTKANDIFTLFFFFIINDIFTLTIDVFVLFDTEILLFGKDLSNSLQH